MPAAELHLASALRHAGLEVGEQLGRGAHTVVYRAHRDGREYAVKVQRDDACDETELQAFRREAAMLASVHHPGLPQVYEVGAAGARPYLVMELLEGRSLAAVLEAGPLDVAATVTLAVQLTDALAAAHRAGLVHRDVKPGNVVLAGDGQARLIDFGLAQTVAGQAPELLVGTVRYAAPEQSGMLKRLVDHRSDLYALGVMLFECLTGQPPFTSQDVGELLRQHAVMAPPAVDQLRGGVPPALSRLVAKLLAKDPDDRYQTALGVAADLRRLAAGELDFAPGADDDLTAPAGDARLVGRGRELASLEQCWRDARAGRGGVVVVAGAPGGGKSRLVRELVRSVRMAGQPVLAGKASPDNPQPLASLREAIDGYVHGLARAGEAGNDELVRLRQTAGQAATLLTPLSAALAALLDQPPAAQVVDQPEQFTSACAGFLTELARQAGGMLIWLDDAHWLDEASWQVLRQLSKELGSAPLLLVCTARDDDHSAAAIQRLRAYAEPALLADVHLQPLDDQGVTELVDAHLGGAVDPELARRLAARAGGNPFAVVEHIRAILDAGLIRPAWGRLVVDLDALDRLDLPGNVLDLVLARANGLGQGTRALLAAAATFGSHFRVGLLARVCETTSEQALEAVVEAVGRRLIEPINADMYAFLHDRVREALLGGLATADLRRLHRRIAETLDADGEGDPQRVYELARHYALGEPDETPRRVFQTGWAAGRAALAAHAAAEALGFLGPAEQAAHTAGIVIDAEFDRTVGAALHAAGHLDEAAVRYERALELERDPLHRADLLGQLARVSYSRFDYAAALRHGTDGLAELGHGLPRNRLLAVLSAMVMLLRGLACLHPRLGFGSAKGRARERFLLQLWLGEVTGRAAYHELDGLTIVVIALRYLYAANRVGPSLEYVTNQVGIAEVAAVLGLRRVAGWALGRARAAARQLHGDPRLLAWVSLGQGIVHELLGEPLTAEREQRHALGEHGRWLPTELYLEGCGALSIVSDLRGDSRQSDHWRQRAIERGLPSPTILPPAAVLGHAEEAEAQLRQAGELLEDEALARGRMRWASVFQTAAYVYLERGELGEPLDQMLAAYHRQGPSIKTVTHFWRRFWLYQAYGRLAQARAATDHDRPARLAAARRAVADLGKLTRRAPVLRAHHLAAQAELARLTGRQQQALDRLTDAERVAEELDAPWPRFEAACVHARLLHARGRPAAAELHAQLALLLAERHGWVHRAARVRREFAPGEPSPTIAGTGRSSSSADSVTGSRDRRQLDALLQVSVAAATVLEPRQLARVALDEIVRILGAERAFLFACPSEHAPLERYAGRDADGNDLDELVGYASSIVERARTERRALIVTGTDQGAALGSESAVAHGLRSIMVAPLQLEGRLLGVVYLDSRVAKGIFAPADVDILLAIANHVAISLETARAAQLEVAVEAERRQRELAEALQDATAALSRTLDPTKVVAQTLAAAAVQVGATSGVVVAREPAGFTVAACSGAATTNPGTPVPDQANIELDRLLARRGATVATGPQGLPAWLAGALGPVGCWLAVPLSGGQDGPPCLAVLAHADAVAWGQAQAGIVAAFAAQGAIAYDNAQLFRRVEQLATTDELTRVANRRHFMALAARALAAARRHQLPVAAIMLDIDHFKRVNDTFGHATGDQVIRTVAARLAATIRQDDLLGRYGGEEFALIVHNSDGSAAELAERLRAAVASTPIPTDDGPLAVTVSVGVAALAPSDTLPDPILARADTALYHAKQTGRNRVAVTPL